MIYLPSEMMEVSGPDLDIKFKTLQATAYKKACKGEKKFDKTRPEV